MHTRFNNLQDSYSIPLFRKFFSSFKGDKKKKNFFFKYLQNICLKKENRRQICTDQYTFDHKYLAIATTRHPKIQLSFME